jgi:hypothetical protein
MDIDKILAIFSANSPEIYQATSGTRKPHSYIDIPIQPCEAVFEASISITPALKEVMKHRYRPLNGQYCAAADPDCGWCIQL